MPLCSASAYIGFGFCLCANLVLRASFPLTSGRKTRALGATISGMRYRCRCAVSRITRIRLFPLLFQNSCSQSSRFLPQARRVVGSGDENVYVPISFPEPSLPFPVLQDKRRLRDCLCAFRLRDCLCAFTGYAQIGSLTI